MNRIGLFQRMKGWFGGKEASAESPSSGAKRYSLGPPDSSAAIAMVGSGAAAAGISVPRMTEALEGSFAPLPDMSAAVLVEERQADAEVEESAGSSLPAPAAGPSRLDPLDPVWMRSLDELAGRLAESAARTATGVRCLENIGAELEGHRQISRAMAEAVRRLPELAIQQAELARQINRTLERQALTLESSLDTLAELRSAFKGVEETSRRQVAAISQLEHGHREVLYEYQALLVQSNRRLGRLALIGIVLGLAALVGVAVALFRIAGV
jgi:hypothetical protein